MLILGNRCKLDFIKVRLIVYQLRFTSKVSQGMLTRTSTTASAGLILLTLFAWLMAGAFSTNAGDLGQSASVQKVAGQPEINSRLGHSQANDESLVLPDLAASMSIAKVKQESQKSGRDSYRRRGRREPDRTEYTMWEIEKEFTEDVFTFVRIQFDSGGGRGRGGGWANDFPDCDWNFSVRLHELTSLKVDPNGKVVRLTDPKLFDYPWVFMSNVNRMNLDKDEMEAMRKYCLKGGFVMADDFWAPKAWRHVRDQMKQVFPNREPRELGRDHEIFNLVYDLQGVPQVPSIFAWQQGHKFEYWHGDPEGDEDPHFWGYFDDDGRLMALMCHNNDIGDGWEREGENKEYFQEYSERVSYPLGINIITYVMTH